MPNVEETKTAIKAPPQPDRVRLKEAFGEQDWDDWDREIEADSNAGRLDFLIGEAFDAKNKGALKDI